MGKLWITNEAYEILIHMTYKKGVSWWKRSTLEHLQLMRGLGLYIHLERDYEASKWTKLVQAVKEANASILKHGREPTRGGAIGVPL